MNQVTTRELQQRTRAVRGRLEAGESLDWTLRGRVVARLTPVTADNDEVNWPNLLGRLQSIYTDGSSGEGISASEQIYQDRG
jgi:antitoxin (DNA-binding transcriptional repressor) of toxin-antitoxin stability system